jgi:hypothetical protein
MIDKNTQEEAENRAAELVEEDETFLDNSTLNTGDNPQFPSDTVNDFLGTVSDEISQNLRQKLLKLNVPQKARLALLANRPTRSLLIQNPVKMISRSIKKSQTYRK